MRRSIPTLLAALALFSCTSTKDPVGSLHGDPAAIEAAFEPLTERVGVLDDVRTLRADCIRTERSAGQDTELTAEGTLTLRRDPPTILFSVAGGQSVREDARERLVLDPSARRATRWDYERGNGGCELGVAAVLLDLERLSSEFELRRTERDESGALALHFTPTPTPTPRAEGTTGAARVTIVIEDGEDVPREVRVTDELGDSTTYRILRPAVGTPAPSDRGAFRLEVPEDFVVFTLTQG